MSTPTIISAGAVTVVGITARSGLKIIDIRKKIPTKIAVKPVRPPMAIPALDSTEVPSGAVPKTAPRPLLKSRKRKLFQFVESYHFDLPCLLVQSFQSMYLLYQRT